MTFRLALILAVSVAEFTYGIFYEKWKTKCAEEPSEKLQFSHCVVRVVLTRTAHERNLDLHVKLLKNFTETCQL